MLVKLLFTAYYLVLAGSGVVALYSASMVSDFVGPLVYGGLQIFFVIGSLLCLIGVFSPGRRFELAGLPLLFVGAVIYAVALITFASTTGRGWNLALILVALALAMARRWVVARFEKGPHERAVLDQ
jgi:hypothetical protein